MNIEAQEIFNEIIAKLNRGEILTLVNAEFLRARRDYLSFNQGLYK